MAVLLASMSTVREELAEGSEPSKRKASTERSPPAKRVHLDESLESTKQEIDVEEEAEEMNGVEGEVKVVTEADVGISAYVNDSLIPIKGGIIKHRCV
jgi:hypothetical protein